MSKKIELKAITGGHKQEQKHRKLKAAASLEGLSIKQYINILLDDALDELGDLLLFCNRYFSEK